MTFLLDTNVLSEARRQRGDAGVKRWFTATPTEEVFLAVLVIGEIRKGVEGLRIHDSAQAATFDTWLAELHTTYADRILPVTLDIAEEWGRLAALRPVAVTDALIAATARVHNLIVVTHNTCHFAHMGVTLLDPFEEE